jgi:hypothetical protein
MRKLVVSNFPPDTTEQEIVGWFGKYGPRSVQIKSARYAIVTFGSDEEADCALEEWQPDRVGANRRVRVRHAQF